MAVNVRFLKIFLDNTVKKDPEQGLVLNDVARLYDEYNNRRAFKEKALPVNFYPLIELYCLFKDPNATVEVSGSFRRIRGFGFKDAKVSRLVSIYVNGTGASAENLSTINELFEPLMNMSAAQGENL